MKTILTTIASSFHMRKEVIREGYLDKLRSGKDLTDVVKVVTGMRRVGKSTLLDQYIASLISGGVDPKDIVKMNLETFVFGDIDTSDKLDRTLLERIGEGGRKYVFLDEIQNVGGWERSVSRLINTGRCDVYVTGSNSKLLSSELATHIAGRFVEIAVLPLSFTEYLELHPGDAERRFSEYLRFGALPEVDPSRGEEFCRAQLTGIFNTVLVDDVLARLGTGDANTLRSVARFLYGNIGNITNTDMVAKALRIGPVTVNRYVGKLEEAFLIHRAERYDIIGKRILKTNAKIYASDLGLRNAVLVGAEGTDISRPLENVVYLELLRRGYAVRIGSYRGREIDFTAVRNGRVEYYQVCLSMMSPETRERELRPLSSVGDNFPKTILTADRLGLGTESGIEVANVTDWLAGVE